MTEKQTPMTDGEISLFPSEVNTLRIKLEAWKRLANEYSNLEGMRQDPMLREDPHAAFEARRYAEEQIQAAEQALIALGEKL